MLFFFYMLPKGFRVHGRGLGFCMFLRFLGFLSFPRVSGAQCLQSSSGNRDQSSEKEGMWLRSTIAIISKDGQSRQMVPTTTQVSISISVLVGPAFLGFSILGFFFFFTHICLSPSVRAVGPIQEDEERFLILFLLRI